MKVFLDTNILLDIILQRAPEFEHAEKILELSSAKEITCYCSSLAISHVFYAARKIIPASKLKPILIDLTEFVVIASVDKEVIERAFSSNFSDFEDAIQHECAVSIKGLNYIITNNRKDFKYSAVKTLNASEFIKTYHKEN